MRLRRQGSAQSRKSNSDAAPLRRAWAAACACRQGAVPGHSAVLALFPRSTMRILAISDLHNNVACIQKLPAQEDNNFNVIALAGDIGSHRADEIFNVLKTFKCPVVYVYGNWDHRLTRSLSFGRKCHLI